MNRTILVKNGCNLLREAACGVPESSPAGWDTNASIDHQGRMQTFLPCKLVLPLWASMRKSVFMADHWECHSENRLRASDRPAIRFSCFYDGGGRPHLMDRSL